MNLPRVRPFLMFEGRAEEAMRSYVSLFRDGEVLELTRYGADEGGPEGTIKMARFRIAGQEVMCIDSPAKHAFTFTPATSLFVDCESMEQFDARYEALLEGGQALMPRDDYGFSQLFGWVQDRFGVSWQINLP